MSLFKKRKSALIDNEPEDTGSKNILVRILIASCILLAGILGAYFLLKNAPTSAPVIENKPQNIPSVQTTSLSASKTTHIPITISGVVEAVDIRNISSRVSGNILSVSPKFEDNQYIKKGDWLFKVDNTQLNPEVSQLRAQLSTAESALRTAIITTENNNSALREMGIKGTSNPPQVIEARSHVNAIKQQINAVNSRKSKADMYAPYNAKVLKRIVNEGDLVTQGLPIAQTYSGDKVLVKFALSDQELEVLDSQQFNVGKNPSITVNQDGSNQTWNGEIIRWEKGNNLNNQFNYLIAEIHHPFNAFNDEESLMIGGSVNTTINSPTFPNLFAIDPSLLRNGNQVWVYEKGQLAIKTVELKYRDKNSIYISSGLKITDALITNNIHLPVDGMKLRTATK